MYLFVSHWKRFLKNKNNEPKRKANNLLGVEFSLVGENNADMETNNAKTEIVLKKIY